MAFFFHALYPSSRQAPPHIRSRSPSRPRPPLTSAFRPSPRLRIDACSKTDLGGAADVNLSILAGLECACHRGKLFFNKSLINFSLFPSALMDLAEDDRRRRLLCFEQNTANLRVFKIVKANSKSNIIRDIIPLINIII